MTGQIDRRPVGLMPKLRYAGGERGWIGDSPLIFRDCEKIRGLGWKPEVSIADGDIQTGQYLQATPWLREMSR